MTIARADKAMVLDEGKRLATFLADGDPAADVRWISAG